MKLQHEDPTGGDMTFLAKGLRKSLFNSMQEFVLRNSLKEWFDFQKCRSNCGPRIIF